MKEIVLASNSPRRKEILKKAGIKFRVVKSSYNEINPKIYSEEEIKKNSLFKALTSITDNMDECLILGADTVVILNSVCMVKPRNFIEAFFMLKKLSNKTHTVITSHTIVNSKTKEYKTILSESFVTFKKLNSFEILKYIILKNPLDKAGSYGIQDFIDEKLNHSQNSFIKEINGSYYNIMGLDIDVVFKLLENF